MPIEIRVPSAGESVTEAAIARWLKKDGDIVRRDEPVVELETDKASAEVPAPAGGRLRIGKPEGAKVVIGEVIGAIEETADVPAQASAEKPVPHRPIAKEAKEAAAAALSPSARALAESKGIDPQQVTGTGRRGRITKEDVVRAAEPAASGNGEVDRAAPSAPGANAPGSPRETRQRMTALRARIGQRLVEAQQTTASLTTFNEADLSAVNQLRAIHKDKFKEKYGVGLGYTAFFVKAAVAALQSFPVVNARIDGGDVVYQNFFDIGVAVSTEKGLMVPVLRDADLMSFAEIEKRMAELAAKARDGNITVDDLRGGTFTITNGGVFGSLLSTPILNPPQTAILGLHAIQKRPVAVGDQVAIRPMMYLALTYDHRLIDGREAVLFLVRIKECIESPDRLLLGI